MEKVLIIDSDGQLCADLDELLPQSGFHVEIYHDFDKGLAKAAGESYSAIITETEWPGLNGFQAISLLREKTTAPIIVISARSGEMDRILGLEMGADDYLSKPFNKRELAARLRAILRRCARCSLDKKDVAARQNISMGDVLVDVASREVMRGGTPVRLTFVEFQILEALIRNAGKIVPKEKLLTTVMGRQMTSYDRSVDVHISRIRRKLGCSHRSERIKTVRGMGYLYILPQPQGI